MSLVTTIHNKHQNGEERPMCSMFIAKQHSGDAGYIKTIVREYQDGKLTGREDYHLVKS